MVSTKSWTSATLYQRQMTTVQRHSPELRELDGAVGLEKLLSHFKRFAGQLDHWRTQQWIDCLRSCNNKILFEYCLNSLCKIKHMRAFEGHSGEIRVDPTLQSNVKIPYG